MPFGAWQPLALFTVLDTTGMDAKGSRIACGASFLDLGCVFLVAPVLGQKLAVRAFGKILDLLLLKINLQLVAVDLLLRVSDFSAGFARNAVAIAVLSVGAVLAGHDFLAHFFTSPLVLLLLRFKLPFNYVVVAIQILVVLVLLRVELDLNLFLGLIHLVDPLALDFLKEQGCLIPRAGFFGGKLFRLEVESGQSGGLRSEGLLGSCIPGAQHVDVEPVGCCLDFVELR